MARKQNKPFYKKRLYLASFAIVIIGAALSYWHFHGDKTNTDVTKQPTSDPFINLKPATEAEKQASQDAKDAITEHQNQTTPTSSNGKKSVTPTIVYADKTQVSGYVNGLLEDGGTCTATFTSGAVTKTFTSGASANVSYTACDQINVSGLSSGSWQLVLSYSSATASGSSTAKTVNI